MNKSSMSSPSSAGQDGKTEAIVEQAKHAVTHVADQAKEQVSNQLNTQFDSRKDKAVETMGTVADAIRGTSEKLKGVGPLGDVAERAATGIENVAQFFEGKKIGDLARDVERFARREPALFLGATFALGLIGGRFLKSSAHRGGAASGSSYTGGSDRQPVYDREGVYGSSYANEYGDDFLADDDFQEAADSMRLGTTSGATASRGRANTLPLGSSSPGARTGSAPSAGSSATSTTGAMGSQAYGSAQGSSSYASATPAAPAAPLSPSASSASSSSSTSAAPNNLGGQSGQSGQQSGKSGSKPPGSV